MENFKVTSSEKTKAAELCLTKEIYELKNEIEEAEMMYGKNFRPMSSVSPPLRPEYFRREREMTIEKILQVSTAQPLKNQGQVMIEELEAAINSDVTDKSLPLLLHQFYLDRIQCLIQCKHLHMLRWCRFCEHTDAIERLFPLYRQRLDQIEEEYSDAKSRAQRLAAAHHSYVLNDEKAIQSVQPDDVVIFLRWLITHLHSTKRMSSYVKILQYLSCIHKNSIDLNLAQCNSDVEVTGPIAFDAKSAWRSLASGSEISHLSGQSSSRPMSSRTNQVSITASNLAFSGFVSNEATLGLPPHTLELSNFRNQLESFTTEYRVPLRTELLTSADEMELFGAVNRRFKTLFTWQQECYTFYQYDNVPEGRDYWGVDGPMHCLKKPSNWIKHIRIKPHYNYKQVRQMTALKKTGIYDELLKSQNNFLYVNDYSKVTECLKEHAVAVREPPTVQATGVSAHSGTMKTMSVWQRIYETSDKNENSNDAEDGVTNENHSTMSKFGSRSKKRESYDYTNTMQMLGLDEGDDTASQDPTVIQGAYLSFLHLRHLKIRDMRRQCLAILNYFKSVERTMTIFDGGLSLEAQQSQKSAKETSASSQQDSKKREKSATGKNHPSFNKKVEQARGGKGHSRGIGTHHYVHNTPADFKIDQNKFMEFCGVENHDDFYTLDSEEPDPNDEGVIGDGQGYQRTITASSMVSGGLGSSATPHVQDQRGYYVIYEAALSELKDLERELLLMASQYIQKDTANRSVHRRSSTERVQRRHEAPGEVDIASYGHREIDRFAVILDMWTCELNFLANKRKLLDCYLESYQNTFDPSDRQDLAQIMTDILHQRPRYDFTQDYFIRVYRNECACLRLQTVLITQILSSQVDDCRAYLKRISHSKHRIGMPLYANHKQEISPNLPKPALKHLDMLEFHPTLGVSASRVTEALRSTVHELEQIHRPTNMSEYIALEKQVLELAQREWSGMSEVGGSFPSQIQNDIFSGVFVEDPSLACDAAESVLAKNQSNSATKIAESQSEAVETWRNVLDVILLRHRLVEAAGETEILSRLYKQVGSEMGFEEFHMYLRLVQFEFANRKDRVDPHPSSITSFIPDDMSSDRYIPPHLLLAVQELDENHLPKFSFRNRESFLQLIESHSVHENLRVAVACQVTHKNALIVAITQSNNCSRWKELKASVNMDTSRGSETRSSHSISTTLTQGTARSGAVSPSMARRQHHGHGYAGKLKFGFDKQKRPQDAFISIQLEKTGPRDVVVNAFIHKKETAGMSMRKPGELEKLKRSFVSDFCREVSYRMSLHAMRSQIVACYSAILNALEPFPSTRDHYFLVGRPHEKKRKMDDVSGMIPDSLSLHRRPRRVLSPDGKCFMNLWFIPHFTEVVAAYRSLDYEKQNEILSVWLTIASSLHDIVLYLCAHARLGNAKLKQQLTGQSNYSVAADWGGAEGVGSELSEIQQQINVLKTGASPHTKDPNQVAELLSLKKENYFLQFDAAVRHAMRETFLATENIPAFQSVVENMHFALPSLSNIHERSLTCPLHCPEPLDPGSSEAKKLFPWLSFQCSNGHQPTSYPQYWNDVESCTQLCLAGLSDTERQCANGEILGVSLLLQEVLKGGTGALLALKGTAEEMPKGFLMLCHVGKNGGGRPESGKKPPTPKPAAPADEDDPDEDKIKPKKPKEPELDPTEPLSKITHPLESYRLMNCFLKLWKQLEILKLQWAKSKMRVEGINTSELFREFCHTFRSEIMAPVFTSMARQMGHLDQYEDGITEDQPISNPPGAPELAVRARLVIKLLDVLECQMISDVRQRIGRELTLVLAERSREETALPADLWRQSSGGGGSGRENFTVSRPHIVEDFIQRLMSEHSTENGNVVFSKDHLNHSLSKLGSAVMQRERENYENYSAYYENLLRHHHHLLYMKELEMKSFKSKYESDADGDLNAQFQLADRSHELILEITALRAKITEMREQSMTMDQDIRDDVRKDYQDLVQNLFEACLQMKARLAQCHLSINDDMRNLIAESREEAMRSLGRLKDQAPSTTAEERLRTIITKDKQIKEMHHDKHELHMLLNKLNVLHHWKRSTTGGRYKVTVEKLSQEVTKTRQDCLGQQLVGKEEADLLREELHSARQSLQASDARLKKAYEQMEREKKLQKEKMHKDAQEERNRQQLEQVRQRNLDRLVIELEEKNKRFKLLSTEVERSSRYDQSNQIKIQKSLKEMHTQLSIERNLKLNAFDQVDNLQAQIMDTERELTVHSPSRPTSAALSIPRSISAHNRPQSSYFSARASTPRFKVRPMTSVPSKYDRPAETPLPNKRPQTAAGRLKNRIAAAILTEMYPNHDEHETVIQLDKINV